jgi:DNA-binding NarL/FixJ family response regulator
MQRLDDEADRIRILLAEIPPMLSDIVRDTVANEGDMMVVGEFTERGALLEGLASGGADVVILGTSEPEEAAVPYRILATSPHIKVLMLEIRGRRAVIYELRPRRRPLGDVSPQRLVKAIRRNPKGAARE